MTDSAERRESSPEFDYAPSFTQDAASNRWLSFHRTDLSQSRNRKSIGCCSGFIFGAIVAAIAYVVANSTNIDYIGDIIVVITFCCSLFLPIYEYIALRYLKPRHISIFVGEIMDAMPKSFCGSCSGIGSMLSLLILHLCLRFTVYLDIEQNDKNDPVIWIVFIGILVVLLEMMLFCYMDYRRQINQFEKVDDGFKAPLYEERDKFY